MPIPRFRDEKGRYEVALRCDYCGYSITKDSVTRGWKDCPLCRKGKLLTVRVDYPG